MRALSVFCALALTLSACGDDGNGGEVTPTPTPGPAPLGSPTPLPSAGPTASPTPAAQTPSPSPVAATPTPTPTPAMSPPPPTQAPTPTPTLPPATPPPTSEVRISELVYDAFGQDHDTFVELFGPAGTSLEGYGLRGINGANGEAYGEVVLTGAIPENQLFLIVNDSATGGLRAMADQLADVDYQNGPDAVQLLLNGAVVDAVAYGSSPGGEGAAAEDVKDGASLARDTNQTDTGDNARDFQRLETATPGWPNEADFVAPEAWITCPENPTVGASLSFDATMSTAPGNIVSYAWDWGDGTSEEGPEAMRQHTYDSADRYRVTLTITDERGIADSGGCTLRVE